MKRKLTFTIPDNDRTPDSENQGASLNIFEIVSHLLRRKRLIAGVTVAVMVLTAAVMMLSPDIYTSSCTILPSGNDMGEMSRLSALAGLAGIGRADENSSELFPVILNSETIRDAILKKKYFVHDDDKILPINLADYFGSDRPQVLQKKLKNITTINFSKKTGVIEIAVETKYPELSQAIVQEYIDQLEKYNMYERRSRAKENAEYLAGQLEIVRAELDDAEDSLETYQASNSDWAMTSDPETLKDMARLQRTVSIKSQTYLYLMQEFVSASLETQKDVPVVRILDRPNLTTSQTGPGRLRTTALLGMLAFLLMVLLMTTQVVLKREMEVETMDFFRQELADAFPRINRMADRLNVPNILKTNEVNK